MKLKKGVKIFLILLAVLVVLFIGLVVVIAIKELNQEEILEQEIINYSNKDLARDDYTISVKTKGDCAYVEESVKKYYKNLSDNVKAINYYLNDKELYSVLSVDVLSKDRPNYSKSFDIVKNAKTKINKSIDNIVNLCDEKTIKSLLDKEKLDDPDYYYDLYLQLIYTKQDQEDIKEMETEIKQKAKDLNAFLDKLNEILVFLQKNDSNIEYEDGEVLFESDSKLEKYNKYVDELQKLLDNITIKKVKESKNSEV